MTPKVKEEIIGGKYNVKIVIKHNATIVIKGVPCDFEAGEIIYAKEATEHKGYHSSYVKDALEWIKANTLENATFLSWWDNGHMIVGYAEREVIIKNPSQEAPSSVADPEGVREFDPHEKLINVAEALTATNLDFPESIMDKYGADYVLITTTSSLTFDSGDYTDLGKETFIYRLLSDGGVEGFTFLYSDGNVRIFSVDQVFDCSPSGCEYFCACNVFA